MTFREFVRGYPKRLRAQFARLPWAYERSPYRLHKAETFHYRNIRTHILGDSLRQWAGQFWWSWFWSGAWWGIAAAYIAVMDLPTWPAVLVFACGLFSGWCSKDEKHALAKVHEAERLLAISRILPDHVERNGRMGRRGKADDPERLETLRRLVRCGYTHDCGEWWHGGTCQLCDRTEAR